MTSRGAEVQATEEERRYRDAWFVEAEDGTGVLVRHEEHWWLICPASATLYLGPIEDPEEFEDCSIGGGCDFHDTVHREAGRMARALTGSPQEQQGDD